MKSSFLKENIDNLEELLKDRNCTLNFNIFKLKYVERNRLIQIVEDLKKKKNDLSKEIGIEKQSGRDCSYLLEQSSKLSVEIKGIESRLSVVEDEFREMLNEIPNIPAPEVPFGRSEDENVVIREWGEKRESAAHSHEDILRSLDAIDIERAVKISGSRFVILKGSGARLERALANLMLRAHAKAGYEEYSVPLLVREQTMFYSGQLPKFRGDAYETLDSMFLIPTSEVALVNIFSNELIDAELLPKKIMAYTPCFRRESGSYGKDTKGLIRLHQFPKVELVQITRAEDSFKELENLVSNAERILQLLNIPYRVVLKCRGDSSFTAAKTYDIEVWMPSQNSYREISSCSNTTDFQAQRASIKTEIDGRREYVHLLNGSGLAVGRTLAALIENYQDRDGSVDLEHLIKMVNDKEEL